MVLHSLHCCMQPKSFQWEHLTHRKQHPNLGAAIHPTHPTLHPERVGIHIRATLSHASSNSLSPGPGAIELKRGTHRVACERNKTRNVQCSRNAKASGSGAWATTCEVTRSASHGHGESIDLKTLNEVSIAAVQHRMSKGRVYDSLCE